jgi:hypothetical protein
MGSGAKSYMWKGFLIFSKRKCTNISLYMRRPLVIYDFAPYPTDFSFRMRDILFSLLSV